MQEYNSREAELDEDEIDLGEFIKTIWSHKGFIVLFSGTVTFLALLYVLSIPNIYSSKALLVPQDQKVGGLGGLSAVASFAGVSMGDGVMTPDKAYKSLLNDYAFMASFVEKNDLADCFLSAERSKNYSFAFGFSGVYDLTHGVSEKNEAEDDNYDIVKAVQKGFSVSADNKSGLITVSFMDADRYLAKKILGLFLEQSSRYLIENKLESIGRKMEYYQAALSTTESFELRKNISELISKLVEEKISVQSSRFFQTELLTKPDVAHVKNKVGPKRGLNLVVSFMISLLLALSLIFVLKRSSKPTILEKTSAPRASSKNRTNQTITKP